MSSLCSFLIVHKYLFIFSAVANAVAAALSNSNANDPNTTKAAKEFKSGVTDKVGLWLKFQL